MKTKYKYVARCMNCYEEQVVFIPHKVLAKTWLKDYYCRNCMCKGEGKMTPEELDREVEDVLNNLVELKLLKKTPKGYIDSNYSKLIDKMTPRKAWLEGFKGGINGTNRAIKHK